MKRQERDSLTFYITLMINDLIEVQKYLLSHDDENGREWPPEEFPHDLCSAASSATDELHHYFCGTEGHG